MKLAGLLLAISCSASVVGEPPRSQEFDVNGLLVGAPDLIVPARKGVIIFGYSQDIGRGLPGEVTNYAGAETAFPAVQIMERLAGAQADPPVMTNIGPRNLGPRLVGLGGSYPIGTYGLELTMGRELALNTPHTWFVGKHGMDGASLVNHYDNPAFPVGGPSFLEDLLTFSQAFLTTFGITNPEENLIFYTIEGLEDSYLDIHGVTYIQHQQSVIGQIRARFGNVRVVFERLHDKADADRGVISAQEQFTLIDDRAAFVYVDDIPTRSDIDLHYAGNGYSTHGVRDAEAIIALTKPRAPGLRIRPRYAGSGRIIGVDSAHGITPDVPAHRAGDVLVFSVIGAAGGSYPLSTPNGYVDVPGSPVIGSPYPTDYISLQQWWVRADAATMLANGGKMPAPIMDDRGGDDVKFGWISVYTDVATVGNPFDVSLGDHRTTSDLIEMPEVTTTVDNTLVVQTIGFGRHATGPSVSNYLSTQLANVIKQIDYTNTASLGYGIGLVTANMPIAGPIGITKAIIASACPQARMTFALKPRVP